MQAIANELNTSPHANAGTLSSENNKLANICTQPPNVNTYRRRNSRVSNGMLNRPNTVSTPTHT